MSDEPFYSPNRKPPPPWVPRPGDTLWEFLWELRKNHHTYSCDLRYQGEEGVEAQVLRDGERMTGRLCTTRAQAVEWAEQERQQHEREAACPTCQGSGWVCEAHPEHPWPHDDCAGPGEPCPTR
jgi:hypothetical protein